MILIISDRPSPRMKPGAKPFEGAACHARLMEWIRYLLNITEVEMMMEDELYPKYRIVNRFTIHGNYSIRCAAALVTAIRRNYPIIALGNNVSTNLKSLSHFKLPHPSGLNRQVNDKEFIRKKLDECKEYIRKESKPKGLSSMLVWE